MEFRESIYDITNSGTNNDNEDNRTIELGSSDSISIHLFDEEERNWFRDAFITEIGDDLKKSISFRELVDVIVCAGKDITGTDLHRIWPYDTGKNKISYDEALHVFQLVPNTNFSMLFQSFAAMSFDGELDYERIIAHLEETLMDDMNDEENKDKKEALKWFREKQRQRFDLESIMKDLQMYQNQLRIINTKIVKEQNKGADKTMLFHQKSSSESLSSLFSNTRINVEGGSNSNYNGKLSGGGGSIVSSFRESMNVEKVTLKSLIIQKSTSRTSCIIYSFNTFRSQQIRINVSINEKIDSSLNRFQNHVFGILLSEETNVIYGITKRKEKGMMCTEWIQLPAGTYTFQLKFCRPIKMIEPERRDEILDSRRLLTKSFRVMLMNLFDMFDLDDDGLLSRDEFELYSILSGSGKLLDGKWEKISQYFTLRDNGLTMKTFIQMHQKEADSYGPNTYLQNMWTAIRQLGHNSKFFMSTACPLLLEFNLSEGASFSTFKIHESSAETEPSLIDYFWENSTLLPYLKEQPSLRMFKTDYFAVLMAGKLDEVMTYKLDLSMSNSVNIEGNDLIIEQKVPVDNIKILTVAIAQADSWYLSVKMPQNEEVGKTRKVVPK